MIQPTPKHKEQAQSIVNSHAQHSVVVRAEQLTDSIASVFAARDAETREVLEGLKAYRSDCWCSPDGYLHSQACLATQALWDKVQPVAGN